jgi:GT2 family glycosyltransferase
VLLLNNDAILFQQGLKTLVEYAENNSIVAGLQGVILKYARSVLGLIGAMLISSLPPLIYSLWMASKRFGVNIDFRSSSLIYASSFVNALALGSFLSLVLVGLYLVFSREGKVSSCD